MTFNFKTLDISITSPPDKNRITYRKKNSRSSLILVMRSQIYLVLYIFLRYNHKDELLNAPSKVRRSKIVGNLQKNESNLNISPAFYDDIRNIINEGRYSAARSVDTHRVMTYWRIGERILVEEQREKDHAEYGTYLIKNLAETIEPEYGSGFSIRQLGRARQFYRP